MAGLQWNRAGSTPGRFSVLGRWALVVLIAALLTTMAGCSGGEPPEPEAEQPALVAAPGLPPAISAGYTAGIVSSAVFTAGRDLEDIWRD